MIEKAVVLAAGSASRMQKNIERYVTNGKELHAVRMGEKMALRFEKFPFLDYQIMNLAAGGIRHINIVIKPDDDFFRPYYNTYGRLLFPGIDISWSYQHTADGTAHALYSAREFIANSRFILLNGDNNYSKSAVRMLMKTPNRYSALAGYDIRCFNERTRDRLATYAVIKTKDGKLEKIIEKASNPDRYETTDRLFRKNNRRTAVKQRILSSMNLWCFTPDIVEACGSVERHVPRRAGKPGEYELPDAVMNLLREKKQEFLVYYVCEDVLDLTSPEDIDFIREKIRKSFPREISKLEEKHRRITT
jgi:dTDP-glucose pyrophosphorylase